MTFVGELGATDSAVTVALFVAELFARLWSYTVAFTALATSAVTTAGPAGVAEGNVPRTVM
ncbi:hypothetical protein, partial [Salinibacterium sp.]|uniref:hypothetical protein n=1 Tax=Salinibacterium sp. TaxID=1915057 RepID=UPI00286D3E6A